MKRYITVAGNIGVGKSTLVALLCQKLGWKPFYEPEAHNPYLADFYKDMTAWGFHSQVFFLANRLQIHREIIRCEDSVVQDRSIYEDAEIFACNLYRQGRLSDRDYETYRALYKGLIEFLPPPDLVIYLRATPATLRNRIAMRNREYEREIAAAYLDGLNQLYEQWIDGFTLCPVLTVPADQLNYVAHPNHLELVVQKVREKLSGKEEVIFNPDEIAQI
ncbi:MAG: deoxynucleoside kinase [Anaerolineaceae bacterium]|nr:deoxynucleoside kinase [Anaerolineaceae bacterium]